MSTRPRAPTNAFSPDHVAWLSLVARSIAAWDDITTDGGIINTTRPASILRDCLSLDHLLDHGTQILMLWFFQRRSAFMSQKRLKKWSREHLDDYILLPASPGYVLRRDCFFISHFWRTQDHPDPDGKYLRLHQAELEPQTWSYIWVDWTCMPQNQRSPPEEVYFLRCLRTMSGIIRNSGFTYFYPPFEPRLWILYEITEFALTCLVDIPRTPDIIIYLVHIDEMVETGVQSTLAKHGYRCSYGRDWQYLTTRLEFIILLKRLHCNIGGVRHLMDYMTWHDTEIYWSPGVELKKYEGTLVFYGELHRFTPFLRWYDGKYSLKD